MTISILGCGWYGLALAKALVKSGQRVKGSTTSADKLTQLEDVGIEPFLLDLAEDETTFPGLFFDCHLLIITIPPKNRSAEGQEYLPRLQKVVEWIRRHQIQQVIFISSTGVYADRNLVVNEGTQPEPDTAAGKILLNAEDLFKQQTDSRTTIIRFGGLVGPGRDPGRFFAGKSNIANGLAPVNLIHLQDCIGITQSIITNNAFGYTFNACAPHHPSRADFYMKASVRSGLQQPEFVPELKEWKIVESVNVPQYLGYQYLINNWYDWLNS